MPTVADLERLSALTNRLNPLGKAAQGEIIRAEDWNALVGAVIEVARVVLAEERQITPAPHEHPDQVTVGWLDPRLRALIERGPLSDPAAMTRLSTLETKVERLAARIEEIASSVGSVRDSVTEVKTNDLTRQAEITGVRRVVEGLDDSRESVRELRETLGGLQKDVTTAVNLGQLLTVDGQPVDMTDLVTRVNRADELRESLRAPDGSVFNAQAFENRLTELTNTLVTQATLDEALETVRRDISPEQIAAIEGNLRNELLGQVNTSVDLLGSDLRAETNQRFAEVDATIETRLSDAMPNITTSVLNTVRPEIAAAVNDSQLGMEALLDKRLTETSLTLTNDYTQRIDNVEAGVSKQVDAYLEVRLPQAMEVFDGRISSLEKEVSPLTERVFRLESGLDDVIGRIGSLSTEFDSRDLVLRNQLLTEMDRRDQLQSTQFSTQLNTLDTTLTNRFNTAIGDSRRIILDEARTVALNTTRTEVSLAETRLRGDFTVISRDAVTDVVRTELTTIQPTLTRSIAKELSVKKPGT